MSDRTTQVRISRATAQAVRTIAAELGYRMTRGVGAGTEGNVADMLDALARGDLEVVRSSVRSAGRERTEEGGEGPPSAGV